MSLVRIATVAIMLAVLLIGLSLYLAPDQLARCSSGPDSSDDCQIADAIVVISGGDTDARTDEAIRLYKQHWAPLIVVSGVAADKSGPSNAEAMRRRAVSQGVSNSRIIIEGKSETTKQNASEVATIIAERHIRHLILVTSGYHMQRALLEFQSELPQVAIRAHPVSRDRDWPTLWWLTPWGWWLAGSELAKIGAFYSGGSH